MSSKRALAISVLLLGAGGCAMPLPADRPGDSPAPLEQVTAAPPLAEPQSPVTSDRVAAIEDVPRHADPSPSQSPERPIEDVVVTATSLSGYWRLTASSSIDVEVGLLSGVRITYSGESHDRDICRIDHRDARLRATCIAGFAPTAEGAIDDHRVTLRWWRGPATVIFKGSWDDAEMIQGAFSGGMVGVSVTGDIPAVMSKLPAPAITRDDRPSAAIMRSVFADLRQGALTAGHYEGIADKRLAPAFSWAGAKAPSHILSYLGRIHIRWHRRQRETIQDVYDVQSPGDRSLCRIALSERGKVIDFACQSDPE